MLETKNKKSNLLWELDLTEAKLGSDGRSRLLKAKKAVEKAARRNSSKPQDQDERVRLETRARQLRKEYVSRKVHYSLTQVRRAIKTARAYETQKIIRRLKASRSANDDTKKIQRIEQELLANKGLDMEALSKTWLVKALEKGKVLGKNHKAPQDDAVLQYLPEWMLEFDISELYKNSAEPNRNVHSRIMNYPVVQSSIKDSVERIIAASKGERIKRNPQGQEEDYNMDESEEELQLSDADDLVASSSSSDDSESESQIDQQEEESESPIDAQESDSIQTSSSEDNVEESQPAKKKVKRSNSNAREDKVPHRANRNLIISSLSAGYISDDDGSVPSDIDQDLDSDDANTLKPKKNRRGQRARQKIWEAKYGRGAKHVVKQVEEKKAKEDKWRERQDKRKHAAAAAATTKNNEGIENNEVHQSRLTNFPTSKSPDKPIHPSWEAKKASQGSIANVAFAKPKKVFK